MRKRNYTWRQLKKFVNSLPEKELNKQVIWWGEERGGEINTAFQLNEDYVKTDEGVEPKSVQDDEEDYEVVYKKGTPILDTD